jgi:hypothetical protein
MTIKDLSQATCSKLAAYRFDQLIERHEGPFTWEDKLEYYDLEFIDVNGKAVLLPLDRKHHSNLTVLRTIEGVDGKSLVLFCKTLLSFQTTDLSTRALSLCATK